MVDLYRGYNEGLLTEDPTRFSDMGVSGPDFLRGMKYTPFDFVGAPVDLLNMGLQGIDAMYGQRNVLGSERPFLGSEDLINRYADLGGLMGVNYDRPTGSGSETLGRVAGGILAPTVGARTVGRVVDAGADYIAGAPARVADRGFRLNSGIDPAAALDDMIVRGMGDNGGVSPADTPRGLLDQPQAAQGEPVGLLADDPVRQMDTAQARYFETGNFEPPTAENPVSIVPPTETEPGIIAFHGSGADFDEFRLEMIGTGEGAQAYGYGLYFTDSEDIAKFYRDSLARGRSSIVYDGSGVKNARETDSLTDREMILDNIATEMAFFDQKPENVIAKKIKNLKQKIDDPVDITAFAGDAEAQELANLVRQSARRELEIYENLDPSKFTRGKMYKVGLAPKPDEFLDYDLPITEQPKKVQDALFANDEIAMTIQRKQEDDGLVPEFYTGQELLQDLAENLQSAQAASNELANAGIFGLKYRAAGSRGAATADEAAERNYVIFDDKAIKILEKYGIVGPVLVTGAGMAREEQPQPTRGIL